MNIPIFSRVMVMFCNRKVLESLAIVFSLTVLLFSAYVLTIGFQLDLLGFQFLIGTGLVYVPLLLMILSVITKESEGSFRQFQKMFYWYSGIILLLCFFAPR